MKFISNFLEENQELSLKIDYIRCLHSEEEAVDFVKKHINQGLPVGMLILTHNAKEINDETWHWMCITGYDDVKRSDHFFCGRKDHYEMGCCFCHCI